ncbi:MAG: flagellar biosynthesis protein FlhA [Candidatus Methylomirabilis oxygeniifera]|uniref:Flagellar biosynthesis protein FlhA n=1 Tax=Methylomirabilis oxygeniifera TaxID=671143 RepID=D5MGB2_METO1|nr:MAG: flagellar biosynthesis protein FlhA [Candidatus Methylomirabilis oxyfera]CBE68793.1 Flagellar biosynthesis protein flhA [Candidatus Methylomirabilis oxyfera]
MKTTQTTPLASLLQGDVLVALASIGILLAMLAPIPPLLLDLLLAANITIALLIFVISLYILRPLDLSVFPSLLLVLTLFRLSLNVASTRLVLLHGNEGTAAAGRIINAFGSFVVGGSYIVGAVVFAILAVIQFMVITKGSGRIAEVSARFTLDAMPGKQLSIDAELNAGLINEQEARARRSEIAREADFYGAMDGASKFVRGDAIAGMIIIAINILGGLAIGVLQNGMDLMEAVQTYTLLTVGDGLVAQIPALAISTAAGIVMTRAASEAELSATLGRQILFYPKPLGITAGVLLFVGLIPGMPFFPFFMVAAVIGTVAYSRVKTGPSGGGRKTGEEGEDIPLAPSGPEKVETLLPLDLLTLEVGYGLIPLVDASQGGDLLERIKLIRRQFALDMGFVVPPVRIRDNLSLRPNSYSVKMKGVEVAQGEVLVGHFLAMDPGTAQEPVDGIETQEPTFGLPARWINAALKERAQVLGYTVVDPSSVVATHLSEVIRREARELVGRQEVQALLDHLKQTHPALVDGIIPAQLSLGAVQRVLQGLLMEGVSIRDLPTILEALADYVPYTKDPILLTEHARQALAKSICRSLMAPDGGLAVLTLGPSVEQTLAEAIIQNDQESYLALEPRLAQKVVEAVAKGVEQCLPLLGQPVFLCTAAVRPHLRRLIERYLPQVTVLSYNEIGPRVSVKVLRTVELSDAS